MDEDLMRGIGSIGYSVRITEWGRGYGKEIMRQGLNIARDYGLDKVILTIDDDNVVSSHICESYGGIMMDKITVGTEREGKHIIRRYWIYLSDSK